MDNSWLSAISAVYPDATHNTGFESPTPEDGGGSAQHERIIPTLKDNVIMAATSVCGRLDLFRQLMEVKNLAQPPTEDFFTPTITKDGRYIPPPKYPGTIVVEAFGTVFSEVEAVLQDLVNAFPSEIPEAPPVSKKLTSSMDISGVEGSPTMNGSGPSFNEARTDGTSPPQTGLISPHRRREPQDGYSEGVFGADAALIKHLRSSTDSTQLLRCIAHLEQRIIDLRSDLNRSAMKMEAVRAHAGRKDKMFDYVKTELQREIQLLRQQLNGTAELDPHGVFSTIDFMVMISDHLEDEGSAKVLAEMVQLLKSEETRNAATDARFAAALAKISTLESEKRDVEDKLSALSKRYVEEYTRLRAQAISQEVGNRSLNEKIAELNGKLAKTSETYEELQNDYELLLEENDALRAQVDLHDQAQKTQLEQLYVQIATLTTRLHAEMAKSTLTGGKGGNGEGGSEAKKWTVEANPDDVALAKQIVETQRVERVDKNTLDRLLAVTERPDDPRKIATMSAMRERIEHLKADVEVWKAEALKSSVERAQYATRVADLEEDIDRIYGVAMDRRLDLPLDAVRTREEAARVTILDETMDLRPIVRTQRADARMVAKRLYFMKGRLNTLVPERNALDELNDSMSSSDDDDNDAASNNNEAAEEKEDDALEMLGSDEEEETDVGTIQDEVTAVEQLEKRVKERIMNDGAKIRELRSIAKVAETARSKEREMWVQQFESILRALPPALASRLRMEGMEFITDEDHIATIRELVTKANEANDEEQRLRRLNRVDVDDPDALESSQESETTPPVEVAIPDVPPSEADGKPPTPGQELLLPDALTAERQKRITDVSRHASRSVLSRNASSRAPSFRTSRRTSRRSSQWQSPIISPVSSRRGSSADSEILSGRSRVSIEMVDQMVQVNRRDLDTRELKIHMVTQTEDDLRLVAFGDEAIQAVEEIASTATQCEDPMDSVRERAKNVMAQTEGIAFDHDAAHDLLEELTAMMHSGLPQGATPDPRRPAREYKTICPGCGMSFGDGGSLRYIEAGCMAGEPTKFMVPSGTQTINILSVPPPIGTVTMVFTDIQSSTALWECDTEMMRTMLSLHNDCMRQLCVDHNGYEVKTEGDAFFVAFADPIDAFAFAMNVQTKLLESPWPASRNKMHDTEDVYEKDDDIFSPLIFRGPRVRMGINLGQPTSEKDPATQRIDYFGPIVNLTARISGVARGGEVVVGENMMRALKFRGIDKLAEFDFKARGSKQFKGVSRPESVVSIVPATLKGRRPYWEKVAAAEAAAEEASFLEKAKSRGLGSGDGGDSDDPEKSVVKSQSFMVRLGDEADSPMHAAEAAARQLRDQMRSNSSNFLSLVARTKEADEQMAAAEKSSRRGSVTSGTTAHESGLELSDMKALFKDVERRQNALGQQRRGSNGFGTFVTEENTDQGGRWASRVPGVDAGVQSDPVVVLTDEAYAQLKARDSPSLRPLTSSASGHRRGSAIGTPKKAANLPPRPGSGVTFSTLATALSQFKMVGYHNPVAFEVVFALAEAFKEVVPPELRQDQPPVSAAEEDALLSRGLQLLVAIHNARCIAGIRNSDVDSALRATVSTAVNQLSVELRSAEQPLEQLVPLIPIAFVPPNQLTPASPNLKGTVSSLSNNSFFLTDGEALPPIGVAPTSPLSAGGRPLPLTALHDSSPLNTTPGSSSPLLGTKEAVAMSSLQGNIQLMQSTLQQITRGAERVGDAAALTRIGRMRNVVEEMHAVLNDTAAALPPSPESTSPGGRRLTSAEGGVHFVKKRASHSMPHVRAGFKLKDHKSQLVGDKERMVLRSQSPPHPQFHHKADFALGAGPSIPERPQRTTGTALTPEPFITRSLTSQQRSRVRTPGVSGGTRLDQVKAAFQDRFGNAPPKASTSAPLKPGEDIYGRPKRGPTLPSISGASAISKS